MQLRDLANRYRLPIRLAGCRKTPDQDIDHRLKSWLHFEPGHDSLLHMSGVDEYRDRVAHHAGSDIEIPDAKLAPRYPILQHLPDECSHPPRVIGDEVRALRQDPAIETVDLRVVSELCAFAAMERQDEAAKPLCRRTIGFCEAGRQIGLFGHRPRSKSIEDVRLRPEVPVDRRMRQGGAQALSTCHVDNLCHALVLAADRGPGGRAWFVSDGEDTTLKSFLTRLLNSRGVMPGDRAVPFGTPGRWPA